MRKLLSNIGETIVETLVSMLIITLVFAFLANAVVTAAHINESMKDAGSEMNLPNSRPENPAKISVTIGQNLDAAPGGVATEVYATVNAALYETDDSESGVTYYYYEYAPAE